MNITGYIVRGDVARCAEAVSAEGFASLSRTELEPLADSDAWDELGQFWDGMPPDDELIQAGFNCRFRRFGRLRATVTGDDVTFDALPYRPFRQDSIQMWAGKERVFARADAEVLLHPAMRVLVGFDALVATSLTGQVDWLVSVHLIRVIADPDQPGTPTPEGRHRDGHMYVGMHLLQRTDCDGGLSRVFREPPAPAAEMVLRDRLDSLIVDDRRLTHQVTPILAGRSHGVRDMLLVDLNAYSQSDV